MIHAPMPAPRNRSRYHCLKQQTPSYGKIHKKHKQSISEDQNTFHHFPTMLLRELRIAEWIYRLSV